MKKKKRQQLIIKIIAFALALGMIILSLGYVLFPAYAADFFWDDVPLEYRLDALGGLIEEVQANYKDEVDLDTMFTGIYQGLFSSLNDPWSGFYTYDISNDYTTTTEEPFVGIGVTFRLTTENEFLIISTIPGGSANEAGIMLGDILIRVGGKDLKGLTAEDVQALVKGPEGTYVTLTTQRNGVTMNYTLERRLVVSDNVQSEMLENNVGYIRIGNFFEGTANDFKMARLKLLNDGAKSLIIDLRGNPGGFLSEVQDICNQMIPQSGRVMAYFTQQGKTIETVRTTGSNTRSVPTVILTDGATASASEFMVAALKDNGVAKIVGETTYGKGVAQSFYDSGNGTSFKYSNFYFTGPSKQVIQEKGITPNYPVHSSDGLSAAEIQVIRSAIAPMTESHKYKPGEMGLNVYAAQQRLQYLGYDVPLSAVMDEKTVDAVRDIQREIGGYVYGVLDYNTMAALENAFNQWLNPKFEDLPLAKALEVLK